MISGCAGCGVHESHPRWHGAVFVCHNEREPGARRASCGLQAGAELRGWLRDRLRAEGLKGRILCTRSGCLDVCSGRGVTVALVPAGGERPVELLVVDVSDRERLWERVRSTLLDD